MPDPNPTNSLNEKETIVSLDQLELCLSQFAKQWEHDKSPPELRSFIQTLPKESHSLALVELVKLDLEYRRKYSHTVIALPDYANSNPEIADSLGRIPVDLIYEDFFVKQKFGETVRKDEYLEEFPKQATVLEKLFEDQVTRTTSLFATKDVKDFQPGDTVDDFDLLTKLGKGAFATVFLARQNSLQRMVALKISSDDGNEPQTLAQLDHPNIVRVYDQRILPEQNGRLLYMKYVKGGTLMEAIEHIHNRPFAEISGATLVDAVDQILDKHGESAPIKSLFRSELKQSSWPETICLIGMQTASALHFAHDQKVLHRDLKPANILLTAEASPQLVDFNISFCSKLDGITACGFFGGSLAYMSPEQMRACDPFNADAMPDMLDERSDIFSIGVVLWELYFGTRPFEGVGQITDWSKALRASIATREAGPVLQTTRDSETLKKLMDSPVTQTLRKCLAFDPKDRFANAEQLENDLRLKLWPEAEKIIRPSQEGLLGWLQRHPIAGGVLIFLIPNVVAGAFNYIYNFNFIVNELSAHNEFSHDQIKMRFEFIQMIINGAAYPIATWLILKNFIPLMRQHRLARNGDLEVSDRERYYFRQKALTYGTFVAILSMSVWCIAGVLYPLLMQLSGIRLRGIDWIHFGISLLLSGAIANVYPFIGYALFMKRAVYPYFLNEDLSQNYEDIPILQTLAKRARICLAIALMLPLFIVGLMGALGAQTHRFALGGLCVFSLIASPFVFQIVRKIETSSQSLIEFLAATLKK